MTALPDNGLTPRQMARDYHQLPWRQRLPESRGAGSWRRGWVVRTDRGFAILERRARGSRFAYDYLRFSSYAFTDWERPDPQYHHDHGSFLPNEYGVSGQITEMADGVFVFERRPWRRHGHPREIVGEVLRSLAWIEGREG